MEQEITNCFNVKFEKFTHLKNIFNSQWSYCCALMALVMREWFCWRNFYFSVLKCCALNLFFLCTGFFHTLLELSAPQSGPFRSSFRLSLWLSR